MDPAANLTFNLSLTESQIEKRAQAPLPYLDAQQNESSVIHYIADKQDDFDSEDDPDDDLDI